jgi:hypothetical protein
MGCEKDPLDNLKSYVDQFNRDDNELYVNYIPNSAAYEWMAAHVPLINIPDKELEAVYYFRWWTFRKHIKKTESGFIISEKKTRPWLKTSKNTSGPKNTGYTLIYIVLKKTAQAISKGTIPVLRYGSSRAICPGILT